MRGRLQVNALTIGEVVLPRSPAPAPAEAPSLEADAEPPAPFALPDLPVAVTVGELSVEKISLGAPLVGQDAELSVQGSARLENGEGEADLNILRLDGPDGIISLKAGFFNETRRLLVDLDAKEAAGGLIAGLAKFPGTPSVDLTLKGDDPISDFDAALRLATDGETRLEGDIRVTEIGRTQPETGNPAPINQIRADIGGDITPLFVPEYREFFGPDVGLVLDLVQNPETGIDISALDLKSYALNLSGAVQLAPNGLPRFVDVDGRIGAPDGLPVVLPLPGDVTELSSADLVIDFDASQSDQFDARIAALGLSQGDYGVDSARMTIEGNLQRADDQGFTIEEIQKLMDFREK
ncbi:MAG: translocation/assembly module TamB, partial [Mangrovicoccus sp.]